MGKKNTPIIEEKIVENISKEPLEEVMGDRYASYAKYVIQDRAIPDVRDGLKPVQRRIIYAMYAEGNTINKPTRKCAHTVGAVMGKYHPHGDSSIYEALARMSQEWKVRAPLIDFQGNNGSVDGDGPAAYRYTESRLSELADELIKDIDKDTVDMQLTFDDTALEPVVLPARFPNLLVNGSEGIAVALATDIPPHNLKEVSDAIIYRINHVRCEISDLRQFIKGPDFPTGGVIYESEGLDNIYLNGRGRIEVAAKVQIEENKSGNKIVISEIPFKVIKIDLVYEIDKIRHSKIIDGMIDVIDESDMDGVRIVINLKKDANPQLILNYLMSKTSLRSSYSANMVAIDQGRPRTLNLLQIIDAYIAHQVDVITRRSKFDLGKFEARLVIVDGLIKAISMIDEVVEVIRKSKDKANSKQNLIDKFSFTIEQAEAIVMLPLYKLNNTDVTILVNEKAKLEKDILNLKAILEDKKKLDRIIVSDLKAIVQKYGDDRKTLIEQKLEIKPIDKRDLIAKEDVVIAVSRDGYIKRSTPKSYKSSDSLPGLKEDDALAAVGFGSTIDILLCFTSGGNYLYIPVHEIEENKWKDEGKHVNYLATLPSQEKIINAILVSSFRDDVYVVFVTKRGQIKRTRLKDLEVQRYTKPLTCMRLIGSDELIEVSITTGNNNIAIFTNDGNATYFCENELTPLGTKAGGVKSISSLKTSYVSQMLTFAPEERSKIILLTDAGHLRIYDNNYLKKTNRLGKIQQVFKLFKSDKHNLVYACKVDKTKDFVIIRYLTNSAKREEIKIDDLHLTPLDKYAKKNTTLSARSKVSVIFKEETPIVNDKTITFMEEIKESLPKELPATNENESKKPIDNDKENKENDNYKQISIFDDLD